MDSSLAYLSFGFIKKFDYFLPLTLNNSVFFLKNVSENHLKALSATLAAFAMSSLL